MLKFLFCVFFSIHKCNRFMNFRTTPLENVMRNWWDVSKTRAKRCSQWALNTSNCRLLASFSVMKYPRGLKTFNTAAYAPAGQRDEQLHFENCSDEWEKLPQKKTNHRCWTQKEAQRKNWEISNGSSSIHDVVVLSIINSQHYLFASTTRAIT